MINLKILTILVILILLIIHFIYLIKENFEISCVEYILEENSCNQKCSGTGLKQVCGCQKCCNNLKSNCKTSEICNYLDNIHNSFLCN
jgi:hypothetical protein